ncbi:MAG: conserved rane protein of unknown function [Actinotalea sp.]|nr:conserved rane protein of unknown function [Actinotalea sp.]
MVTHRDVRPEHTLLPAVRVLLVAFGALTAAAVVSLLVLADRTAAFFAWTIEPPATAAFLGAGYGAGLLLTLLALRTRDWAVIRVPFLTVTVFTWLTAVATLLHRDRLHDVSPGDGPVAEPAAWLWMVVYVVVPVAMAAVLVAQDRAWQPVSTTRRTMPGWLAALLAVQGGLLGAVGAVLLLAPAESAQVWPWALTPFTARIVAAWLLSFAVATAASLRLGDLAVLRIATTAYAAFGALQLVGFGLHGDALDTSSRGTVYVVVLVVMTLTGAAGVLLARRDERAGDGVAAH